MTPSSLTIIPTAGLDARLYDYSDDLLRSGIA
jgi:hypothetical protein